ncbi:hypothetical protein [Xanthomonas theicola]|uniref:Uncharacterized protein n=2 Tax=Xanthomonas theicola TaxID=56464 RepID=A0A2S6ZE65_9XANT|nr:hypothetical protein [Xanthomonas theicola]PPT90532.1 hypothetical protein XthCFBP4691_11975 [Xanthomonas theicola]QNH26818.1 hypothetical protein G4Q83_21785 [Xanthomonas theicola]
MPNDQDFLRKHDSAGDADDAVQAALARLAGSPSHITASSVIHGIAWTDLLKRMFVAVINADVAADPDGMAYAIKLFSKEHGEQWNIVLTDLDYVDVTRQATDSGATYKTGKYRNGNVFITAIAAKNDPGLLGEVVHLVTAFGSPAELSP